MKRIILYSMKNCPHCQTAKRYLEQNNIAFRLCDVKSAAGQKEFSKTGLRGVPVLKVGEQFQKAFLLNNLNSYIVREPILFL